jgi:hypothetical protein
MKKTNVLRTILYVVFPIIFNVLFFIVAGTEHCAAVWISYGFIHFAYLMLLLTPLFARKGKNRAIFGFSLSSISGWYFALALIAGLVFIILEPVDYAIALIVQAVITGIYLILLVSNMITNERTVINEESRQTEVQFIKTAASELLAAMNEAKDSGLKKKYEDLYDAIRTSPVKSDQSVSGLENGIMGAISQLRGIITAGNIQEAEGLAENISHMVKQRNNILRSLN